MRLSFATDTGEIYAVEVDQTMEVESLMALLEAECGIPVGEQSISLNGRELNDPKATLASAGVQNDAMLHLRRKVVVAGRTAAHDEEMMRLQLLGDPNLMQQLRENQPELAHAIQNDPQRFGELLQQHRERQREAEIAQQREIATLNADPYNVDAQKRIEEAIRQQAALRSYTCPVSPECAEQCGLLRLLDKRFAGIAKGVGTAKILGRVHSAQLKIDDLHLPCAFTIMEGRDVDLLFGLDMLKAHQACIDLEKNVLRIQGREVRFLSEHELPDKARQDTSADLENSKSQTPATSTPAGTQPGSSSATPAPAQRFPGAGNTLGSTPAAAPSPNPGPPRPAVQPRRPVAPSFPEEHITTLQGFGVTREQAIELLQAAQGNLDVAAALLFQ
ncbi:DNA damage-inducible protein 1 [Ceratobasidium sp. 423]|nr:DNA damage-inducible protein 1 [Ceratobasidium sp. 423]